jgi:hypothetical protein
MDNSNKMDNENEIKRRANEAADDREKPVFQTLVTPPDLSGTSHDRGIHMTAEEIADMLRGKGVPDAHSQETAGSGKTAAGDEKPGAGAEKNAVPAGEPAASAEQNPVPVMKSEARTTEAPKAKEDEQAAENAHTGNAAAGAKQNPVPVMKSETRTTENVKAKADEQAAERAHSRNPDASAEKNAASAGKPESRISELTSELSSTETQGAVSSSAETQEAVPSSAETQEDSDEDTRLKKFSDHAADAFSSFAGAFSEARRIHAKARKVREKERAERKQQAYEEKLEQPVRKLSEGTLRIVTWMVIAAVVTAGALLIRLAVRKWDYRSLKTVAEQTMDNPLSSSYAEFGGGVLRYSADSATYYDADHKNRWEISYNMTSPKLAVSDRRVVIYDAQGSTLVICSTGGEKTRITTELPVQSAVVSDIGTTAAMMTSGNTTLIRYYSSTGEEISTIRTTMNDPGTPMSMALSGDGMQLAVAYLGYTDDALDSQVRIYGFDSEGQTKVDNIIGRFSFDQRLIPEVSYIGGDNLAVFFSDGFAVIEGGNSPAIRTDVKVEGVIDSLFYNDRNIGYVLENENGDQPFLLNVYDASGREITRTQFDFTYETVEFSGTQISLYNRGKLCVYGIDGERKYNGDCGEQPGQFFATGAKQYVISDSSGLKWLRLE